MWAWIFSAVLLCLFAAASLRVRAAVRAERAAIRLMRLSARDLRAVATSLHGLAGARSEPGLAIAAAGIFAVADTLQTHAPPTGPVLRAETIDLHAAITEAVAAATAALSPGKRLWRLQADTQTRLWADARALRHILAHVLADAVRATREQDWIEISLAESQAGLTVIVQDEGEGLIVPDQPPHPARQPRHRPAPRPRPPVDAGAWRQPGSGGAPGGRIARQPAVPRRANPQLHARIRKYIYKDIRITLMRRIRRCAAHPARCLPALPAP